MWWRAIEGIEAATHTHTHHVGCRRRPRGRQRRHSQQDRHIHAGAVRARTRYSVLRGGARDDSGRVAGRWLTDQDRAAESRRAHVRCVLFCCFLFCCFVVVLCMSNLAYALPICVSRSHVNGSRIAAPGIGVWNPAFDVTPFSLITCVVVWLFVCFSAC